MTNQEILNADLLDILFEHRNKSYGAYALRRYNNNRLLMALGIALSATGLFFLISLFNSSGNQNNWKRDDANAVILTTIDLKEPKKELPPPPVQKKPESAAQVKDVPIVIAPDEQSTLIPDQDQISLTAISDKTIDGVKPGDINKGTDNSGESQAAMKIDSVKGNHFIPFEKMPSFPGGPQALALFFSRTLNSPTDLEPGEKKVIQVRFVVGADGSVTKAEITQSGGDSYDREVLRAFKRMPKWEPAIQNGINVATSFTQPVTFIGTDQ